MGQKRSFDEEGLQELSFKNPKQHEPTEQLTPPPKVNHFYGDPQTTDVPGDDLDNSCESQSKDDGGNSALAFNDTEFNTSEPVSWGTSAPVSWGTSRTTRTDMESLYSSVFPELFEFSFPRRNFIPFEDTYSSLLNSSPRKEVHVGPDHQADIPLWDPEVANRYSVGPTNGNSDNSADFMVGSCVVPMPDLDFSEDGGKTEGGKLDCNCFDSGSVRCVQQHVHEAREELKETIGLEKFVKLGFLEMGEEVAQRWTEEEEHLFHEVVYSNPVSHGRNFWVNLLTTFPSRTMKELVSYYFNVFMLRRRAVQNRASWLEVDSDDDEWRGIGGPFEMTGDGKKSAAVSFINQDVCVDHGNDSQNEYDNDDDDYSSSDGNDDDDDDDDDDGDGDDYNNDINNDGDLQVGEVDVTENAVEKYCMPKENTEIDLNDQRFQHMPHHFANSLGTFKDFLDLQDNSCTSFELNPCMTGSRNQPKEKSNLQETKANGACIKFVDGNSNGSTDNFGCHYALDACDGKVWDAAYPVGLMSSVDLLPTCNMMEEIFGPCTWNKSGNDKSVS